MSEETSYVAELPGGKMDHPLGIYFGLREDDHHADVALGSSDMKRLSYSPPDFFWESRHNPLWKPEELTPALIQGRAKHTCVLEGREKFEKLYGRKTLSYATKEGKQQKERFEQAGKTPLPEEEYDRALLLGQIIRSNPNLAGAFDDTIGVEVSVFWTRGGIKRKARFDCLKERAIVDLKNISNDREISFQKAALRYIDNYQGHVQAEHYREARTAMSGLMKSGLVFGYPKASEYPRLMEAATSREFAFVFVFAQSSGAPLTWSTKLSYRERREHTDEHGEVFTDDAGYINPIFELGRAAINRAEHNYKTYVKRYGLETPWLLTEPIEELDIGAMPSWFVRNAESEGV